MAITLFENIYDDLTIHEKNNLVPMLKETLMFSNSKNRMTANNLSQWFKASGENVSALRVRIMIGYLRIKNAYPGKIIIGASTGFFLTSDLDEADRQIDSLRQRVLKQTHVIDALIAQREEIKWMKEKVS